MIICRIFFKAMYNKILDNLNNCSIGYDRKKNIGINFLTRYHAINRAQHEHVCQRGRLLSGVIDKINAIYCQAISDNDRELLRLLESGMLKNKRIRQIHRDLYSAGLSKEPLPFRADSAGLLGGFVEYHLGFTGLGFLSAFRRIMEEYYGAAGFFNYRRLQEVSAQCAQAIQDGYDQLNFFFRYSPMSREVGYYFREVFYPQAGRSLFGSADKEAKVKLVLDSVRLFYIAIERELPFFWNKHWQQLIFNPWHDLITKYLRGKAGIIPVPYLLHEQKICMALLYQPRFSSLFSEAEKSIFPKTSLVARGNKICAESGEYSLDEIINLAQNKRRFILKYAGLNLRTNWGGQRVYSLKWQTKKGAGKLISKALSDYEKLNEPWIIQEDISSRVRQEYFDISSKEAREDELYSLFQQFFVHLPKEDNTELLDISLLLRKNFLVHKQKDAVFGLVSSENAVES